jgi:hypothetical protein
VVANKVAAPAAFQAAWPVEAVQTGPAVVGAVAAAVLLRVRYPRHHHLWRRASSPSAIDGVAPPA